MTEIPAETPNEAPKEADVPKTDALTVKGKTLIKKAKAPLGKLYAVIVVMATLGGAYGTFRLIFPANTSMTADGNCRTLSAEVQMSILEKAQSPEQAAEYARALRCDVFPNAPVQLAENSIEKRFEDTATQLAQSSNDRKRRALVLIADASTREEGFSELETLAETAQEWQELGELASPWNTDQAIQAYVKSLEITGEEVLAGESANYDIWTAIHLSRLLVRKGKLESASLVLETYAPIAAEERDRAVLHNERGDIALANRDFKTALNHFELAQNEMDNIDFGDDETSNWRILDRLVSHERLSQTQESLGDLDNAYFNAKEALKYAKVLTEENNPEANDYQPSLFSIELKLSLIERSLGQQSKSRGRIKSSLQAFQLAVGQSPTDTLSQQLIASAEYELGRASIIDGEYANAKTHFRKSEDWFQSLLSGDPVNKDFQHGLLLATAFRGDANYKAGDQKQAELIYTQAISLARDYQKKTPEFLSFSATLSDIYISRAQARQAIGNKNGAEKDLRSALSAVEVFQPEADTYIMRLRALSHTRLAELGPSDAASHWASAKRVYLALKEKGTFEPDDNDAYEKVLRHTQ